MHPARCTRRDAPQKPQKSLACSGDTSSNVSSSSSSSKSSSPPLLPPPSPAPCACPHDGHTAAAAAPSAAPSPPPAACCGCCCCDCAGSPASASASPGSGSSLGPLRRGHGGTRRATSASALSGQTGRAPRGGSWERHGSSASPGGRTRCSPRRVVWPGPPHAQRVADQQAHELEPAHTTRHHTTPHRHQPPSCRRPEPCAAPGSRLARIPHGQRKGSGTRGNSKGTLT